MHTECLACGRPVARSREGKLCRACQHNQLDGSEADSLRRRIRGLKEYRISLRGNHGSPYPATLDARIAELEAELARCTA